MKQGGAITDLYIETYKGVQMYCLHVSINVLTGRFIPS